MERLTKNDLNKVCYDPWELCGMDNHCTKDCHEEGGCIKGCHILKMYRKLAEYEDLEEQGLFLKLPCKVGDIVYEIINCGITCPMLVIPTTFKMQDLPLFEKKRMFLTREEAEQALKEMEGE